MDSKPKIQSPTAAAKKAIKSIKEECQVLIDCGVDEYHDLGVNINAIIDLVGLNWEWLAKLGDSLMVEAYLDVPEVLAKSMMFVNGLIRKESQ